MKASTLASVISNTIMIIMGVIWWLLFYCFGKFNIPMWVYKAALATTCIYMPLMIWAVYMARKDILNSEEKEQEKPEKKARTIKVYGSSSNE